MYVDYILEKYGNTMKDMVLDENGFEKVDLYIINNNNKYRAVVNNELRALCVLEEESNSVDCEWYKVKMLKATFKGLVLAKNDISLIIQNGAVKRAYINNLEAAQKDFDEIKLLGSDSGIYIHCELVNIKDEDY